MKPFPLVVGLALVLAGTLHLAVLLSPRNAWVRYGGVVHETRSDFSHIRIRERGSVRSLLFVDETGAEQCQSSLDLESPAELRLAYTRGLFLSLLARHPQDRVLVVGLGGGGMVRFLEKHFPETRVESVEIDPVVVRLAGDYFGVHETPQVRLHVADAFEFLDGTQGVYDAVYLDAFLRAPESSGLGEKTARLKERAFLETLRDHLDPGGVAAFNLIEHDPRTSEDIASIREVFPAAMTFEIGKSGNLVVLAPREAPSLNRDEWKRRAADLDASLALDFSLSELFEGWRD